ncbi:MAG: thiolase domain-containing protein [Candidatus Diapherotrites archaeon]|nr:thiolase domain-containing protein [Candidatus Diapherotrites archaeon]
MRVVVVGAGITKFGEHWGKSFRELIVEAAVKAIQSSGLRGEQIEAIYGGCMASGRLIGQEHIGALIADQLGLNPIPSTRCEAACASGGVALRTACLAIKSGMHSIVAVGGVEKMTELSTQAVSFALGGAGDQEIELFHGATFPSLYALLARAHMHEFGTTEEQMASVAVKNHANALLNPNAQFHKEITIEDVMNSAYVAEPIKLLDCSPITDGAAALILASEDKAKELGLKGVEILASEQASDTLALSSRESLTELKATRIAAQKAYEKAGIRPSDIDFAEVHDCFTIAEILAIEDLGFFKKGEGGLASEKGKTSLKGKIPINPSGGLKAKGHPVGATGVAQAVEAYYQLMRLAEQRQIKNARIGLTHNVGGSGATAVVTIYKRFKG